MPNLCTSESLIIVMRHVHSENDPGRDSMPSSAGIALVCSAFTLDFAIQY